MPHPSAPAAFWEFTTDEVLLLIRQHQRRMEQWDDLLTHHAMLAVDPYRANKPSRDFQKLRLYQRE